MPDQWRHHPQPATMRPMVDRTLAAYLRPHHFFITIAGLGLVLAACGSSGGGTDSTSGSSSTATDASTGTGTPTGSGPTSSPTESSESLTGSISGTDSDATSGETTATAGTTESVDPSTTTTATTTTTTTDGTTTLGDTSTTDASTGSSSTTDGSSSTTDGCIPTEASEVTCDKLDNDCDGNVDNIDAGGDGICDCLNIGILGNSGFAPNANFEAWLEDQGSSVTRTLLLNKPGVVTPAFLAAYDLVLIDRIERALSAEEAAALEAFVKTSGRGMITLIGYNFDNNNPVPERDRANTALTPFGLAYQGGYFGNAVIPTFDQNHPVSMGIMDVNFAGGIEPVDLGKQGQSDIFSTWQGKTCGIAHQTAMMGGRVIVWGDEWLTFDSDWQGYADVQDFWVNMVDWARPQDFCGVPQ